MARKKVLPVVTTELVEQVVCCKDCGHFFEFPPNDGEPECGECRSHPPTHTSGALTYRGAVRCYSVVRSDTPRCGHFIPRQPGA